MLPELGTVGAPAGLRSPRRRPVAARRRPVAWALVPPVTACGRQSPVRRRAVSWNALRRDAARLLLVVSARAKASYQESPRLHQRGLQQLG